MIGACCWVKTSARKEGHQSSHYAIMGPQALFFAFSGRLPWYERLEDGKRQIKRVALPIQDGTSGTCPKRIDT
jgi:hypothetical protein